MEKNKDDIAKYIKNEKEISQYKISTIEKKNDLTSAKKRILEIEKEFVSLPLETMSFEDVADVAAAISIYRDSRALFYKTFALTGGKNNTNDLLILANSKFEFLKNTAIDLSERRVQESNFAQDPEFYSDLIKMEAERQGKSYEITKRYLDKMDLHELLEIEPKALGKKRGRYQSILYSISTYINEELSRISIKNEDTVEQILESIDRLDRVVNSLKSNQFKYYNQSLKHLQIIDLNMGKNSSISKIRPLQNLLNFSEFLQSNEITIPNPVDNTLGFNPACPQVGNLLFGVKKVINLNCNKDAERNVQNKVHGILFPISRISNEKMTLLYKKIIIDDVDVTDLFSDSISNIKSPNLTGSDEYFKALMMLPFWKIISACESHPIYNFIISKITGINNLEPATLANSNIASSINFKNSNFFNINNASIALTPKTRSEEDGIKDIVSKINIKVSEIIEDYIGIADDY